MSSAHQYHQSNAPDSHSDDSDSDLELNLQELENDVSGSGFGDYSLQQEAYDATNRWANAREGWADRQIPLRNLRIGRTRGANRDVPHSGAESRTGNVGVDRGGLHQEHINSEESHGSFSLAEDDAPLLSNKVGQNNETRISADAHHPITIRLKSLKAFLNGSKHKEPTGGNIGRTNSGESSRNIVIGQYQSPKFPLNAVSNAKYNAWSFLPLTLYNEFSFFYNLYFLLVALSQIIPPLRVGYLSTYVAPLAFVLTITLGKEALDDIARRKRDTDANKAEYTVLRYHDLSQAPISGARRQRGKGLRLRKDKLATLRSKPTRLDAIEEEEERIGGRRQFHLPDIEIDEVKIKSRDLKVGDVVKLNKDQRVPADLVILKCYTTESSITLAPQIAQVDVSESADVLRTVFEADSATITISSEPNATRSPKDESSTSTDEGGTGEAFLRTDQLDGETDWKLRTTSPLTQSLDPREFTQLTLVAAKPDRKVNEFFGTIKYTLRHKDTLKVSDESYDRARRISSDHQTAALTIDNTAWANTVLASNATVLAVVVYTGPETRQAMSTTISRSKTGLLDHEINSLSKILFAFTLMLSIILVALEGFASRENQAWYISIMKFLILFSTIIPISLRVNLDMGKSVYAWFIERDQEIPGTVVRTSTIPEELGRIEYLLSDKTGTLTQNGMTVQYPS